MSCRLRSNKVDALWDIALPPELTDARHTAFCIHPRHTLKVCASLADGRTVRDDGHILPLACVAHDTRSVCPGGQANCCRWAPELQPADLTGRESLGPAGETGKAHLVARSLPQDLMDQRDSTGSLAHRRRDALHAAGPDVTHGEDAGKTCFEHKRGASQGPVCSHQVGLR